MNRKLDTANYYTITSDSYDELYSSEQQDKYRVLAGILGGCINNIIDVGCGTGLLTRYIDEDIARGRERGFYIVGIDLSIGALRMHSMKTQGLRRTLVDLVLGDGEVDFYRGGMDTILASFTTIHHFHDKYGYIRRLLEGDYMYIILSILTVNDGDGEIIRNVRGILNRKYFIKEVLKVRRDLLLILCHSGGRDEDTEHHRYPWE